VIEYFRKKVQHPIFTIREMFEFVVQDAKKIRESMDPDEVKDIDNDDYLIELYLVKVFKLFLLLLFLIIIFI